MDVTKPFQSFVNGQSASPISASSSSNFVPKTSEWSEADQKYLELALSCVDSTSDTFLEQIAERVPSKTITQVARRYVAMGGDLGIKGLENNCPAIDHVSDSNKTDCQKSYCWDKVEQKSFCIGLEYFGEGRWEDIAKYCVKTKSVEQVAHYGSIYCDPKNRPRGMDLLGKRKSKETDVVASPSLPSSADSHSVNAVAASNCELQFPWKPPSALIPNSNESQRTAHARSGSTTSSFHKSSNACAERPTKRYRDGIYSGNIGQSSEHLSNMPVQQIARIPYVERTSNNSLPGASIPSYLRPTPVENSGRSSIFQWPQSTHVLQPRQHASPSSQNANRSTQLSGITTTGFDSGSFHSHSDNRILMNGMDISQHGQCSYSVHNQDRIYGSNGNNWLDKFSSPGVTERLTSGCQNGAPMLNGNSTAMNQTDNLHSQINDPSAMDGTPVGSTSDNQLYQETLDFLFSDD